jgi:hypothetical protein
MRSSCRLASRTGRGDGVLRDGTDVNDEFLLNAQRHRRIVTSPTSEAIVREDAPAHIPLSVLDAAPVDEPYLGMKGAACRCGGT